MQESQHQILTLVDLILHHEYNFKSCKGCWIEPSIQRKLMMRAHICEIERERSGGRGALKIPMMMDFV